MLQRVVERDLSLFDELVLRLGSVDAVRRTFSDDDFEKMLHDWRFIGRKKQQTPAGDDWSTWLVLAGRGFGKTRTGSEFIKEHVETGRARHVALIAPTARDLRKTLVEGVSGILKTATPGFRPHHEPSKLEITWPNGAKAYLYSAEEPDRIRGGQHDLFWCDELAFCKNPHDVWDQLQFTMRLGKNPRGIVTTTPRPLPIVKGFMKDHRCRVIKGSMYENKVNLAAKFIEVIVGKYEGTRLGGQEIWADILEDNPNALWQLKRIEELRRRKPEDMVRIVVAVDPAVTANEDSDETGIVVVGKGWCSCKGPRELHTFTLDDRSGIYTPAEWADEAMDAYETWKADAIVAEVNNGGDLVEANIRANANGRHFKYKPVHATRGKAKRAEPISALAEQGTDHHCATFPKLENEMTQWNPNDPDVFSPNRMDAKVWGATELVMGADAAQMRSAPRPLGTSRYPVRKR